MRVLSSRPLFAVSYLVACFATSKAQAFATYTSLHYSGVLSGYSQTWKDPFDVGGGYCYYPFPDVGSGDLYYQCQGYDF